jgi:hypothetical protein
MVVLLAFLTLEEPVWLMEQILSVKGEIEPGATGLYGI